MRILFLGNNWMGVQVIRWLRKYGESIIGLIVHDPDRQKYGREIMDAAKNEVEYIFYGSDLRKKSVLDTIKASKPDIGIAMMFGYILKPEFLNLLPQGCLNLHPSLLPYNRGVYPNVWSIVENTPIGTTLHYIDEGIDTGDIIAQQQIHTYTTDTGKDLHIRIEQTGLELFKQTWPLIKDKRIHRRKQPLGLRSYHEVKDVEKIDEINLDKKYKARDLINILRARTFKPYKGAYFMENGRKIYLSLELESENEI